MANTRVLLVLSLILTVFLCSIGVSGKPTIYKRNNNDKLEPVLIPVSSTVIPISVYKVAYGIGIHGGDKLSKPNGPTKLITANKKKFPHSHSAEVTYEGQRS